MWRRDRRGADNDVHRHILGCAQRGDACIEVDVSLTISKPHGLTQLIAEILLTYHREQKMRALTTITLNILLRGDECPIDQESIDTNHLDFSKCGICVLSLSKNIQIVIKYKSISSEHAQSPLPEPLDDMEADCESSFTL